MKLSEKQLEVITKTVLEIHKQEIEKQEKQKQDRRLRNVKLLLQNYRSFVAHTADIKLDINDLDQKLELDELETDEFAIRSIKRSKERTLAMVMFINKMLQVYKTMCEQSNNPEEFRKYKTIDLLYISGNKKTFEQVAECHHVHVRTVNRDAREAIESLSVLIFGVDGIRLIG